MSAAAPNKALGQNFLTDKAAVARIIDIAAVDGRRVLEIGPGTGALTYGLADRAEHVTAVEIDRRLAESLPPRDNLEVIIGDILDADLDDIMGAGGFTVCANLPYYITTPIAVKLALCPAVESVTLMVQREAAGRFTAAAGDGQYGPMAALYGRYFSGNTVFTLSPAAFDPRPEVDSAVVRMERIRTGGEAELFKLARAAFAQRRKTLKNNLSAAFGQTEAERAIAEAGLDPSVRAERLDTEQLATLARLLMK